MGIGVGVGSASSPEQATSNNNSVNKTSVAQILDIVALYMKSHQRGQFSAWKCQTSGGSISSAMFGKVRMTWMTGLGVVLTLMSAATCGRDTPPAPRTSLESMLGLVPPVQHMPDGSFPLVYIVSLALLIAALGWRFPLASQKNPASGREADRCG